MALIVESVVMCSVRIKYVYGVVYHLNDATTGVIYCVKDRRKNVTRKRVKLQ